MKQAIETLINKLNETICKELDLNHSETFDVVLNAYNQWQETEHDSVDYIFNVTDRQDLIDCLEGGITMNEIIPIYNDWQIGIATPYFMFGQNHTKPNQFKDYANMAKVFKTFLKEIIKCALSYPSMYEEFYGRYITNTIYIMY